MKQVGVDLCGLPEAAVYRFLIICIHYLNEWSEAKPITDKSTPTIAQILHEMMYRHGCFLIQVNDQSKNSSTKVSDNLFFNRCSTVGYKCLSPTIQWLS